MFNRWGVGVYNNYGSFESWNGYSKGSRELPQATYYYIIKLNDDRERQFSGDISIIR